MKNLLFKTHMAPNRQFVLAIHHLDWASCVRWCTRVLSQNRSLVSSLEQIVHWGLEQWHRPTIFKQRIFVRRDGNLLAIHRVKEKQTTMVFKWMNARENKSPIKLRNISLRKEVTWCVCEFSYASTFTFLAILEVHSSTHLIGSRKCSNVMPSDIP